MNDWTEIKKRILELIQSTGIKPIYPLTLLVLFISYSNFKKLKVWEKIHLSEKSFITVTWITTIIIVIVCIISILTDIGIIDNFE